MQKIYFLLVIALLAGWGQTVLAQEAENLASRGSRAQAGIAKATPTKVTSQTGEVYPNPVSGRGEVTLSLDKASKITVYNLLGNPVLTVDAAAGDRTAVLDFSDLSTGVYFTSVTVDNRTVATRRVVVKR